ncbi:hypothetical protein MJD09_12230 [bacterium]|nr:hypothetical protein [bacterium]
MPSKKRSFRMMNGHYDNGIIHVVDFVNNSVLSFNKFTDGHHHTLERFDSSSGNWIASGQSHG